MNKLINYFLKAIAAILVGLGIVLPASLIVLVPLGFFIS